MFRLLNVHFPSHTMMLLAGEAVIMPLSPLLAAFARSRSDLGLFLSLESGGLRVAFASGAFVLCMCPGADPDAPARQADSRVTRVEKWIQNAPHYVAPSEVIHRVQ